MIYQKIIEAHHHHQKGHDPLSTILQSSPLGFKRPLTNTMMHYYQPLPNLQYIRA